MINVHFLFAPSVHGGRWCWEGFCSWPWLRSPGSWRSHRLEPWLVAAEKRTREDLALEIKCSANGRVCHFHSQLMAQMSLIAQQPRCRRAALPCAQREAPGTVWQAAPVTSQEGGPLSLGSSSLCPVLWRRLPPRQGHFVHPLKSLSVLVSVSRHALLTVDLTSSSLGLRSRSCASTGWSLWKPTACHREHPLTP